MAASVARVADADWTRSCETVRRCAPNIGAVGQWRAYCEGEWPSSIPSDLLVEDPLGFNDSAAATPATEQRTWQPETRDLAALAQVRAGLYQQNQQPSSGSAERDSQPASPVVPTTHSNPQGLVPPQYDTQPPSSQPATPEPIPLSRTTTYMDLGTPVSAPPAAAATSSPAPAPPTPTTKPPVKANTAAPPSTQVAARAAPLSTAESSTSIVPSDGASTPRLTPSASEDSSKQPKTPPDAHIDRSDSLEAKLASSADPVIPVARTRTFSPPPPQAPTFPTSPGDRSNAIAEERETQQTSPVHARHPRGDYMEERRVSPTALRTHMTGVGTGANMNLAPQSTGERERERAIAAHVTGAGVGRRTSVDSTSSHVAAMRDRYVERAMPGSPPPAPRDMPRLGATVADMATKYTPIDQPSPRRAGVSTPLLDRDAQLSFPQAQSPTRGTPVGRPRSFYGPPGAGGSGEWDTAADRRRHLQQELAELDQQDEYRARERDLARQQAELDRERHRLATMRGEPPLGLAAGLNNGSEAGYSSRSTSSYGPSAFNGRPPSASGNSAHGHGRRSGSPTPQASAAYAGSSASNSGGGGHLSAPARNAGHSPACGCWECSGKHYSNPPSPARSPARSAQPLPSPGRPALPLPSPSLPTSSAPGAGASGTGTAKKGNWVRRLSMPVIAGAFSDGAKKTPLGPAASMGPGMGGLGVPQSPSMDERKRSFDRDGVGNFGQRRENQQTYNSLNSAVGGRR